MTQHFVDASGIYLGGFGDGAVPPEGSVEVTEPPHGLAVWQNGAWVFDAEADARKSMTLSFAQLLIGLVTEAWITESEGEAWLSGSLPAAVLALISTLPVSARFAARARAARPSVIERSDPLVSALGAAQGKSDAEIDAFFTTYANA